MGSQTDCTTGEKTTIPDFNPGPDIPRAVTRYQFLAAIRAAGRAADLKTYIQGLSEAQQESWLNRRVFIRNSPMIEAARVALNVTNNALNNLFISAADIDD